MNIFDPAKKLHWIGSFWLGAFIGWKAAEARYWLGEQIPEPNWRWWPWHKWE